MIKEKQIEEMCIIAKKALDENRGWRCKCNVCAANIIDGIYCDESAVINGLYNAGYRKQSEWISVDERLPEWETQILVTDGKKVIVAYRNWLYRSNNTGRMRCPANYGNGMYVTHWMPLPEPPKMNGGE